MKHWSRRGIVGLGVVTIIVTGAVAAMQNDEDADWPPEPGIDLGVTAIDPADNPIGPDYSTDPSFDYDYYEDFTWYDDAYRYDDYGYYDDAYSLETRDEEFDRWWSDDGGDDDRRGDMRPDSAREVEE